MTFRFRLFIALSGVASIISGCTVNDGAMYRGGVLMQEAPLDIQEHHSYRFTDKWRISHRWLSGPTELRGCSGYPSNSFRRLGGYGELGNEINPPFVENNGTLYIVSEHKGIWSLSNRREFIYGLNREGVFEGYLPFCSHGFKDSLDSIGLYIVQPDPAKGTDEWISGAKPVTINGLQWLHKEMPMQDWSESRERLSAPIEYWVLKIPDTPYWMMLRFSASSSSKFGLGAGAHPDKHQRLLDLFHQIVQSVKLEPITAINIDSLIKEVR